MTCGRSYLAAHISRVWLAAFLTICIAFADTSAQASLEKERLVVTTASGNHAFDVEIAKTPAQQARGLMFRRTLGARNGMLFLYEEPQVVSMWMRNTYIPLDMIFIRADGKVHRVERSAEPLSERIIGSGEEVTAVLELAGGTAARIGLKPGDVVEHAHFKTAQR